MARRDKTARPRHGARVLPFARTILRPASAWLGLGLGVFAGARESAAAGQTIRVVAYNIEADVNGNTAPNSGLYTVRSRSCWPSWRREHHPRPRHGGFRR